MRTKWGKESPPPQDLASCSERVSPVPDLLELAGLAGQTSQYSELLFVQERVVNAYHCALAMTIVEYFNQKVLVPEL